MLKTPLSTAIGGVFSTPHSTVVGSYKPQPIPPMFDDVFTGVSVLPSHIDFGRLSAATYFNHSGALTDAAIDEPRFESDGLLLEESSTNFALYSHDYSNVRGFTTLGNVDYVSGTCRHRTNPAIDSYSYFQNISNTNQDKTLLFYLSHESVAITSALIDMQVMYNAFFLGGNATVLPSGLTRVIAKPANGSPSPTNNRAGIVWRSNKPSGLRLHNMQYEQKNYASSLIKTSGSSVTRAADVATYDLAAYTGSILYKYKRQDNEAIVTEIVDFTSTNNPPVRSPNCLVGAWCMRNKVFNRILTGSEKAMEIANV